MEPKGQEELGYSYLVINATLTESVTNLDGSDVWESLSLQANDSTIHHASLQLTLCMTASEAQEMEIHATRLASVPAELALTWNTSTAAYSTETILRQLGGETRARPPRNVGSLTSHLVCVLDF